MMRQVEAETTSISTFHNLAFQGRKLTRSDTSPPLVFPSRQAKVQSPERYRQISCAEVDYTQVDVGSHRLPVNFNATASEYRRLLITNGKSRGQAIQAKANPLSIQNIESLNVPIFLRNQEQRQKVKIQQQEIQKVTNSSEKPIQQQCGCCCCQNFCQYCSEQIKLNQKLKDAECDGKKSFCLVKKQSIRNSRQIFQNQRIRSPESQPINYSQLKRQERAEKEKRKASSKEKDRRNLESYLRIMPLIKNNLEAHECKQYVNLEKQAVQMMKEAVEDEKNKRAKQKLKEFASKVRWFNQKTAGRFQQKFPWGIDQQKVIEVEKLKSGAVARENSKCHHTNKDPTVQIAFADVSHKPKPKTSQVVVEPCHPILDISSQQMSLLREMRFREAMSQVAAYKRQQLLKKQNIEDQLKKVKAEAKNAISQMPQRPFKPKKEYDFSWNDTDKKRRQRPKQPNHKI